MSVIYIKGGIVVDPTQGIDGEIMDIFVKDGKIVEESGAGKADTVIDAKGMTVVAGGIDIHAHIAGPKINAGRAMRPEDMKYARNKSGPLRCAMGRVLMTCPAIGYEYARMGYTTAIEPATPALYAIHTHEELDSIPMVDKAVLPLFGNWHLTFKFAAEGDIEKMKAFIAWAIERSKGFGVKVVNPGGVEAWKYGRNVHSLDERIPGFEATPAEVLSTLIKASIELNLPHKVHVHCNNLGVPGSAETTAETIKLAEKIGASKDGRESLHITHIQFNAYTGEKWRDMGSGAEELSKLVNRTPVTVDMGQPIFGHTTTMTADGPFEFALHKLFKSKWINKDVEIETGGGIVPITYRAKSPVNAVQWATGLEFGLLVDADKVVISTDYPNGGPFVEYPYIMTLLMSRKFREKEIEEKGVNSYIEKATSLPSLDVERTFYEIVKMTRSTPAKILGLENKGTLKVGADADITIYPFDCRNVSPEDYEVLLKGLRSVAYTIKDGEIVVKDGEIAKEVWGRTFWVNAVKGATQEIIEEDLNEVFRYYTVSRGNYGVREEWIRRPETIAIEE